MRMVRTADSRPILGMYTVYAGAEAAKDTEVQRRRVSQQFVVEVEHVNPAQDLSGARDGGRAVRPHARMTSTFASALDTRSGRPRR